MQRENAAAHEETRRQFDAKSDELRGHFDAKTNQLAGLFDARSDELAGRFDEKTNELAARFDAKTDELRRHFDVSVEESRNDIRQIAEGLVHLNEKLDRETGSIRDEMRRGFADTQAMIKFSHAELDRRVSTLEANQQTLERSVSDLRDRVERLESTTH